ncbi:portal protein [Veillonella intestinalis]|uniref:portal protein n=1 Tax=Veillonella intestinalis TaxID=2941341 RepID=UPI00203E3FFE|nr:portal protein [Veillonella intestinalis]
MFDIYVAKDNVKRALLIGEDWRKEAHEDYAFVQGNQWTDADRKQLKDNNRPCITINRIRPVVNLLCGYAAQNETEPDFMPRSEEDDRVSRVAKGITKYVLDRTNYQREKKKVFRDVVTCGLGAYWISYDFDYSKMDGQVLIERMSPFDVFKDPESIREDLSDAMFCGRYTWESKDKLKQVYPDKVDEIERLYHKYDDTEQESNSYPQWFDKDLKKVRVVQYWYKVYDTKTIYVTSQGVIDESSPLYGLAQAVNAKGRQIPDIKIRYATFADDVLLEDNESPYSHGRYPLVYQYCYYSGADADDDRLEPAGIVRDIKDAQRELNKNRSQRMHIVNQQALGVRFWYGVQDERTKKTIKDKVTTPGANLFLPQNVTFTDGLPANQSIGNIELENQASSDFYTISGITPESLSGSISASMSGKAIDLRQSVTTVQTADIFDKAKEAERQIVLLLWGDKGKAGLIPQYYNESKAMRILGDDGKAEFAHIEPNLNQAMVEQQQLDPYGNPQLDEDGNPVKKVLYDLSAFDFDITIVTSQASATARKASLYQLLEAKQSGADIPMEIIIKYMDFPDKDEMLKIIKERSSQPAQPDVRLSANVKDLPAEALSEYLQTIGVNISPQQIMAERLASQGSNDQLQINSAMQAQQGFAQQQQLQQQAQQLPQELPPRM